MNRETLKSALAPTSDCLTPQQLEACMAEPHKQNAHLSSCAHCQAELAMLQAFESDAPLPGEGAAVAWISSQLDRRMDQIKGQSRGATVAGASLWTRMWAGWNARILVPAAAVMAVAIASFVMLRPAKEPDLRADAGNGPVVFRSQQVDITGPVGSVSEAPKSFAWKAYSGAARYKISLMEVDRNPLWDAETGATSIALPDAIRGKLLTGKTVLWQVTALDAQGKVLATSQAERLVVLSGRSEANP